MPDTLWSEEGQTIYDAMVKQRQERLAASDSMSIPHGQAIQDLELSEKLGVPPQAVAGQESFFDQIARRVPDGALWADIARKSPQLASMMADPYKLAAVKENVTDLQTVWDTMQDMKAREQLGWGQAFREYLAQGASRFGQLALSPLAAAEAGVRVMAGEPAYGGLFPTAVVSLNDVITESQKEVSNYRETFLQSYVAQPISGIITDPSNVLLPIKGAAMAGTQMASKTLTGMFKEMLTPTLHKIAGPSLQSLVAAQGKAVKFAFNELAAVRGAALIAAEQSAGMSLMDRMKERQADGEAQGSFLLPNFKDMTEATLNGVTTYMMTLFGGLSSELRFANASQLKGGAVMWGKDILSEGGEEAIQSAINDAYSDGEISLGNMFRNGLKGAFAVAPLGIANLMAQSSEVLNDTAAATQASMSATNKATLMARLPQVLDKLGKAPGAQLEVIAAALGDNIGTVSFKAEDWDSFWTQKDISPDEALSTMGGKRGADGKITFQAADAIKGLYASKDTQQLFVESGLFDAEEMTYKEAQAVWKELPKQLKEVEKLIQQEIAAANDPARAALDDMTNAVTEEIVSTGRIGRQQANAVAQVVVSSYDTMAQRVSAATGKPITAKQLMEKLGGLSFKAGESHLRGEYDVLTNAISLMKHAKTDTVLHELGHHYLNVLKKSMADADLAPAFTGEFDVLKKWWKDNASDVVAKATVKDGLTEESLNAAIDTGFNNLQEGSKEWAALHEYFANGFLKYVYEGKAPSNELRGVFQRFVSWITTALKKFANRDVNVSPEMKMLFSRLIASDEAINAALNASPRLHVTAEDMGMDPVTFTQVTEGQRDVIAAMHERMYKKVLDDLNGKDLAEMAKVRDQIEATVLGELNDDLAYNLLKYMDQSKPEDKINREDAKGSYPDDVYKALDKSGLLSDTGVKVADLAIASGMTSEQLAERLTSGVDASSIVVAEVEKRMNDAYQLMTPEELAAEAKAIVEGTLGQDLRAEEARIIEAAIAPAPKTEAADSAIEREMKATSRKMQTMSKFERMAIKFSVMQKIGDMTQSQLRPVAFRRQAQSLAKKANKHLLNKEFDKALLAKHAEYYMQEMAVQAEQQLALLDAGYKSVGRFDKSTERRAMASKGPLVILMDNGAELILGPTTTLAEAEREAARIGGTAMRKSDALQQIDAIMEAYGLSPMAQQRAANVPADRFPEYVKKLEEAGWSLPAIDDLQRRIFPAMASMTGVDPKTQLTSDEVLTAIDAIETIAANANRETKVSLRVDVMRSDLINQMETLPSRKSDHSNWFTKNVIYLHSKLSQFIEQLDGGDNKLGIFWKTIKVPITHANARVAQLSDAYLKAIESAEKKIRSWKLDFQREIPGVGRKLSRSECITVAGLYGSKEGRQRLGQMFSDSEVQAILNSMTSDELDVVEAYWKANNELFAQVVEEHKKIGAPVPAAAKIEPFRLGNRTMSGGYTRIEYDTFEKPTLIKDEYKDVVNGTGVISQVKERAAEVGGEIVLNLSRDAQLRSAQKMMRYIAFHNTAVTIDKIVNSKPFKESISKRFSKEWIDAFNSHLEAAIAGPPTANTPLERGLRVLRRNGTVAMLGFKLSSAAQQVTGFSNAVANKHSGGLPGLAKAMASLVSDKSLWKKIEENDPRMAARSGNFQNDIAESIASTNPYDITKPVANIALMPISIMQSTVDHVVYLSAYEKAIADGHSDIEAKDIAYEVVVDTQGGGSEEEVAAVQHSQLGRFLTMMMSWQLTQLNQQFSAWRNAKDAKSIARALYVSTTAAMIPAFAGLLIKGALQGEMPWPDDEDKESLGYWFVSTGLKNYTDSIVGVRDVVGMAEIGMERAPIGMRPLVGAGKMLNRLTDSERRWEIQTLKEATKAAGGFAPVPTGLINQVLTSIEREESVLTAGSLFGYPYNPRQR